MADYKTKKMSLDLHKERDHELFHYLEKLPHNQYTLRTKEFWLKVMEEDEFYQAMKQHLKENE